MIKACGKMGRLWKESSDDSILTICDYETCILHVRRLLNSPYRTFHIEVKHEMISILKKVEKVNNDYRDLKLKAEALAYWQTYLRIAK